MMNTMKVTMSKNAVQNQINPPLPKKKRVDSQGNNWHRAIMKTSLATMTFADHVSDNGWKKFIVEFPRLVENCGMRLLVDCKKIQ